MPAQNLLTVGQATTIRKRGEAELVAHNVSIQPDRYTFANFDELNAYLTQVLGAQSEGRGIRGSMSRKGLYLRHGADGTEPVTFGDPVLDAVSSAAGGLVVGDQTIDLREGRRLPIGPASSGDRAMVLPAPNLTFTGIVNGAERWASNDGSMVEFRLGTGRLAFHAWKKSTVYQYWSMGAEISVYNTNCKFKAPTSCRATSCRSTHLVRSSRTATTPTVMIPTSTSMSGGGTHSSQSELRRCAGRNGTMNGLPSW